MGNYRCTRVVNPHIAIRVIPVIVGVDQVLEGRGSYARQRRFDLWLRHGDSGIAQQFPVWSVQHHNVAARTHNNAQVAAKLLNSDCWVGRLLVDLENGRSDLCTSER